MQHVKLRPLSRRTLFALFVEGRPLGQRPLRRLGLQLQKQHREELLGLGLAEPTDKGLALTPAGRAWVANQSIEALVEAVGEMPALEGASIGGMLAGETLIPAGEPAEQGPAGAEAAPAETAEPALAVNAPPAASEEAPPARDDAVAEQAWRLADQELARALQEAPRLRQAAKLKDLLPRDLRAAIGDAAMFLRAAAEKRRMTLVGEPGETAPFDEDAHSRDDPRVGPGVQVRVQRPGVRQGSESSWRMILKADVVPIDQSTE